MGSARGFRLRDPFDGNSGASSAIDQQIGIGDGAATRFAIVKHYGAHRRRITRPVTGSVRVAVDGEGIGRASCWERGCQYVLSSVVAVPLKKKIKNIDTIY